MYFEFYFPQVNTHCVQRKKDSPAAIKTSKSKVLGEAATLSGLKLTPIVPKLSEIILSSKQNAQNGTNNKFKGRIIFTNNRLKKLVFCVLKTAYNVTFSVFFSEMHCTKYTNIKNL